MRRVYIVRHGLTNSDAQGLVQTADSALSEEGIKQAEALAERFCHLKFDHLLASDYKRAVETAEYISAKTKKKVETSKLLREMRRPSQYQNSPSSSPEYRAYLKLADENVADKNWRMGDGENFYDVLERIKGLFSLIEASDGDFVLITHARMTKLITLYVMMKKQPDPLVWRIVMNNVITTNTGITSLVFNDKHGHWQLESFNDKAHFAE
ncbi:MAG: histidine phosphatase family protein [Candidatus Nomurabacteria bacterium]|nr:histidine phosphatase family protein [Candidatus Nomurabacteria bacterium]USN87726.1 MAG: histidine phosphatase family protein [Candidatus Nomurabacteria bacterium]